MSAQQSSRVSQDSTRSTESQPYDSPALTHPLINDDVITEVIARLKDPNQSILSDEDVSSDVDGLQQLMKRGAWKSVLRLSGKLISTAKYPHHKLRYRLARIIGMIKMRMHIQAFNEFVDIGKIDDPKNLYETYPDLYPNKKGSLVPFSMRQLYAEIFYALGRDPNMDHLHTLRLFCASKIIETQKQHPSGAKSRTKTSLTADDVETIQDPLAAISPAVNHNIFEEECDESLPETWVEREQRITFSLITKMVSTRNYVPALQLFNTLLARFPKDPVLLSCVGRIYLMMGALPAAEATLTYANSLLDSDNDVTLKHMNNGFLAFANDQLEEAIDSFRMVLAAKPTHPIAANNLAICYLHSGDVNKGIEVLEEALFGDPSNLHEILVFNLCSMYDLATEKSIDKRKKLVQLIRDHATDDFNISCLKLPST